MQRMIGMWLFGGLGLTVSGSMAGPYTHVSVMATDPEIIRWASNTVGFHGGSHGAGVNGHAALGPADGSVVPLGELARLEIGVVVPGEITLTFGDFQIVDDPGDDFVVFENAFEFDSNYTGGLSGFWFAELGFVEVSSNGEDFTRFPNVSLSTESSGNPATDMIIPWGRTYAGIDPTNVDGLAGFTGPSFFGGDPRGIGFDLARLANNSSVIGGQVDLRSIRFVRIVDITGSGDVFDSLGNPIYDAWDGEHDPPTDINGFDLDAIGVFHGVPEPASIFLLCMALVVLSGWLRYCGRDRLVEK